MLLHTDTMQAELYHTARRAYQGTAEKKYQDRKELYGLPIKYRESVDTMIEELYKQLHYPGRVPGLKRLPPKPMMYCVQDEEFDMQGFYRFVENIGATAIVTSTATLDDLTDNGCLKFGLAHEIAHMIIRLQPELAGSLLPNDIRIGQEIVDRNLRDNDEMRQFAEELVADRIAMTITRDLRHARVFLQMIDKNHKKLIPKLAAEFVEEERLKRGDTYTSIEREVRTKEAVQQFEKIITTGFGVHPTNALRFALLEDYRKELAEKDQGGRYRVY